MKDYIGILIRNTDYNYVNNKLIDKILKENEEHNIKTSKELLLLNKQGILFLTPSPTISKYKERLSRVEDLYEIALVFNVFLKDYIHINSLDNSIAQTTLTIINFWIDKPNLIFRDSVSNSIKWSLLLDKLKIKALSLQLSELQKIHNISAQDSDNVDNLFEELKRLIVNSSIDCNFKEIAIYDLEQSQLCYNSKAYKSCVVMLGAVVEGLMLGTILEPSILNSLKNDSNCPPKLKRLGLQNPNLSNLIPNELSFEDFKNIIHYKFPEVERERFRIDGIQDFRNAIHPWKSIQNETYADFGSARAVAHIAALSLITKHFLT